MTDTKKLKNVIDELGISYTNIAKKLGLTRESFYNKMNNIYEFKASEIQGLKNILSLTNSQRDEIFFS